jgi:hypothetical protein
LDVSTSNTMASFAQPPVESIRPPPTAQKMAYNGIGQLEPPYAREGVDNVPQGGAQSPHQRLDGRRDHADQRHFIHASDGLRNLLAGRAYEAGIDEAVPQMSTRRIMRPKHETMTKGSTERNLLEAEMSRKDYDANRFCNGDYRRLKAGAGWEGPDVLRSEKTERIAASNPMYGNHHFFLGKKRSDIRAGTDEMLRTLGWEHLADTGRAGAPSTVANKWADDIHTPRGPALTENSHLMRPDRNPITGHNMGGEFTYCPGERHFKKDRVGKNPEEILLSRTGQETNTKERVFGDVMDRQEHLGRGKGGLALPKESLRTGIASYSDQIEQSSLFPDRESRVGGEREVQRMIHERNLREHYAQTAMQSETARQRNKIKNSNSWRIGD